MQRVHRTSDSLDGPSSFLLFMRGALTTTCRWHCSSSSCVSFSLWCRWFQGSFFTQREDSHAGFTAAASVSHLRDKDTVDVPVVRHRQVAVIHKSPQVQYVAGIVDVTAVWQRQVRSTWTVQKTKMEVLQIRFLIPELDVLAVVQGQAPIFQEVPMTTEILLG